MKIDIPGGSGQIGAILSRHLLAAGHEVVVLSRKTVHSAVRVIAWDAENPGPWENHIDGADIVINLAGRSVNCRYNAANRRAILESRVRSTRAVGRAITSATRPPRAWLQMSTATIYAHRFDAPNDEFSGIIGGAEPGAPDTWRFSIDVARAWEAAATEFVLPATRQVLLRSAMVMSPDRGGVFDVLLGLVRMGLGGTNGTGRQSVSWIHELDFVRAIDWLIANDLDGPVNLASPNPLSNATFMQALRQARGARFGLPAPAWLLELGAIFLRTETELILKSRRVIPGQLLRSGFTFRFPEWPIAVADLCHHWRTAQSSRASAI
jgi:uncharacterized protein